MHDRIQKIFMEGGGGEGGLRKSPAESRDTLHSPWSGLGARLPAEADVYVTYYS